MEPSTHLPDLDFGLKMRFTKGDIATFFGTEENDPTLCERRALIAAEPDKYSALHPEGEALLDETIDLSGLPPESFSSLTPREKLHRLGELWKADYLLMKPDDEGIFRLRGGCVCFPSHWDLGDKMAKSMAEIHGPVPGLNETLGRQIDGFLERIKPDISWERGNWGLARSPELNLHPSLNTPRLDNTVGLDEVWWRLEEQSLVALPKTNGILFGIKLVIEPLRAIKANPSARDGLIRALQSMPDAMAEYKGLGPARERLIEILAS